MHQIMSVFGHSHYPSFTTNHNNFGVIFESLFGLTKIKQYCGILLT